MAVQAAGGLFEATVRSASHLNESVNKANVLFGDSAKIITGHAQEMANAWSEPKQAVMDMTNKFALMGREIGYSKKEAAEFGVKVSKMALDARSLGDAETAAMKIEAALAGQSRPLRALGVFINAATVKEEAARMGMQPGASGQLSEGQKIKARMSLIENSEFMKKAAGDLARTFQETEGQTRAFWGAISNLATSVGEELNPAWNKLLQSFNTGLDDLKGYFERNKSMVRGWGDSVVEGFETAKVVWRNLPDTLEIALLGADQKMEDARAKIEQWATSTAVAVETTYLKASKSVAGFVADIQNQSNAIIGMHVGIAQQIIPGAQSAAKSTSNAFDSWIGEAAKKMDIMFRPVRDLTNFIERKTGLDTAAGPGYKQMSVEEDIGRLKGSMSYLAPGLGQIGQFLGIFKENLAVPVKPKDEEETALIDKANKHLADTMAENTDISTKAIAAAQERIFKREAERLNAIATAAANAMPLGSEQENILKKAGIQTLITGPMTIADQKAMINKLGLGPPTKDEGKKGGEGDEDAAVLGGKTKHHKGLEDTASFFQNMAGQQLGGDVQERQLTELQAIREADQKNADMMEKMYNKTARAAYS